MINNDVLRSVRYSLDLSDKRLLALIADGGGQALSGEQLKCYLLAADDTQCQICPDLQLAAFLNGLIRDRRGARGERPVAESRLGNNLILKKLRIAFSLRDDEVYKLVQAAGSGMSRAELNAVFQKPGHRNYRVCGDQLLRHFLLGLSRQFRPDSAAGARPDNS